jgi:hypothetical protein
LQGNQLCLLHVARCATCTLYVFKLSVSEQREAGAALGLRGAEQERLHAVVSALGRSAGASLWLISCLLSCVGSGLLDTCTIQHHKNHLPPVQHLCIVTGDVQPYVLPTEDSVCNDAHR